MSKHLQQKERHLKMPEIRKPRRAAKANRLAAREHPDFGFTKRNIIETLLSAALYIGACFTHFDGWISLAVFAVPFLAAVYTVAVRAAEEAAAGDYLNESILVIAAAIAAFALGQFSAGSVVMVLYRVGRLLEAAAVNTSRKIYAEMKKRLPDSINVETEAGLEKMHPQEAGVDDIFVAAPGEMLALDGIVIEGMSSLDISMLTGETENITVAPGSRAISGCINVSAPLRIRAETIFAESTAAKICAALENVQKYKSNHEKYIERFERIYTPAAAAMALLIALLPPIFNGEWRTWISRGVVILVLSNTAALSVTAALSYLGASAIAAKCGIVIKGTRFVEALSRAKTMVFNKTGTITEGKYTVLDVVPRDKMTDYELLCIAAAAEQRSEHPIAKAICAACGGFEREVEGEVKTENIPGRGVSSVVRGKHVYVGNAALLEEHGIHCDIPKRGGAAIHVAVDDVYCGYIIVSDRVREGAFDCLEELRVLGVQNTVMLTSDVRSIARPVAASLNFEMVKPELMPEGKVSAVEYLRATKPDRTSLAYICDRASDADVLERADVGVTLAAIGSDAAFDSADVLIMADELRKLPESVRICRQAADAAWQNSAVFAGARLLLLILGVSGALSISGAAAADFIVSVLMFANSYRTIFRKYQIVRDKK